MLLECQDHDGVRERLLFHQPLSRITVHPRYPTRTTVLITPGSSGPGHHWPSTVGFLADSLQPRFWFSSQTPHPVRSQRVWPRIPVPISRLAELRTGAPICPHSGWGRQGSRPCSSMRDPETEALSVLNAEANN